MGNDELKEALRQGSLLASEAIELELLSDQVLHAFAWECVARILTSEREHQRDPLACCWDLLEVRRMWNEDKADDAALFDVYDGVQESFPLFVDTGLRFVRGLLHNARRPSSGSRELDAMRGFAETTAGTVAAGIAHEAALALGQIEPTYFALEASALGIRYQQSLHGANTAGRALEATGSFFNRLEERIGLQNLFHAARQGLQQLEHSINSPKQNEERWQAQQLAELLEQRDTKRACLLDLLQTRERSLEEAIKHLQHTMEDALY